MATSNPDILIRSNGDSGLVWTIGASALIHFGALAAIAFAPQRLFGPPPRLESFTTVELVAPAAVGGTNLVRGPGAGKQPVSAPKPPVAAAKPEMEDAPGAVAVPEAVPNKPAPPPPPKVEEAPKAEAVPPPKPPEPVKAEPPKEAVAPEVPKPVEPPKPVAKAEPPPKPPAPEAKKPEVQPAPKPAAAPPKAKVEPPPAAAAKPVPPAPPAEPAKVAAEAAPAPPPAVRPLDKQIAAAVQRKADEVKAGADASAAPADVDQRISAAVRRRVQDAARGAATGVRSTATAPGSGGPIGYGPGTEPGGKVVGEAYVRYLAHMQERIKATWAWAGANSSLKVVVHFNITPTGELINIRTIESSGDPTYDASVERAVRAASPLDPPPVEYQEQFSTVELEFLADELRS